LRRVFPYDWVYAIEILSDYGGFAVHKGLLHELPLPVLLHVRSNWKCVFANEVFLFYVPQPSALPAAEETHQTFFFERLEALQKNEGENAKSNSRGATALLIVASHSASSLDNLLRSTVLLHAPTLVVVVVKEGKHEEAYRAVCSRHNAQMEEAPRDSTIDQALKIGIQLLLEDPDTIWICSFDDTMLVRPDFLSVAEKFRSQAPHSKLGGLWTHADCASASHSIDGFQVIVPQRENTIHCYGHRDYWRQKYSLKDGSSTFALRDWKKFLFGPNEHPSLVIRDLVTFQKPD
jgi:hypothetical protein